MLRVCRHIFNKTYTTCQRVLGAKVAASGMIHFRSEIRSKRNISLGERSILYKDQSIYLTKRGKLIIGNDSHIAPYGYLLIEDQTLTIGDDVAIGPHCSFFCSSNTYSPIQPIFRKNYEKADIQIGNNVFIGAQSVILPGTVVGNNVIIAANSVVRGRLEDSFLYGGSPCKPIKKLSEDD